MRTTEREETWFEAELEVTRLTPTVDLGLLETALRRGLEQEIRREGLKWALKDVRATYATEPAELLTVFAVTVLGGIIVMGVGKLIDELAPGREEQALARIEGLLKRALESPEFERHARAELRCVRLEREARRRECEGDTA